MIKIATTTDMFGKPSIKLMISRDDPVAVEIVELSDKAASTTILPNGLMTPGPKDGAAFSSLVQKLEAILPPQLLSTLLSTALSKLPQLPPDPAATEELRRLGQRRDIHRRGDMVIDALKEAVDALHIREPLAKMSNDLETKDRKVVQDG